LTHIAIKNRKCDVYRDYCDVRQNKDDLDKTSKPSLSFEIGFHPASHV